MPLQQKSSDVPNSQQIQGETPKETSKEELVTKYSLDVSGILNLELEEVISDSNDNGVIDIQIREDEGEEDIKKKLYSHLKEKNWWMREYWANKGLPQEQFMIHTLSGNIEIFNFSEILTSRHIQELTQALQIFASLEDQTPMQEVKYILIDNEQRVNPYTAQAQNGNGPEKEHSIKIYPNGLSFTPHRIPSASNFEGTIIHELSHAFGASLRIDWQKTFGWEDLNPAIELPGGTKQYYKNNSPDRCVTDYAKFKPTEDICESMVAAIRSPETLDPDRLKYIREKIFGNTTEVPPINIIKADNVSLPKLEQPIKFKVEKKNNPFIIR